MPEYLSPGVYIEEVARGPTPIEGVPTSTAAFIGETERGATMPRLITSYAEYERWFGGVFGEMKFMPYAVRGFFENGGKRLYVCRVTNGAATRAEAQLGAFTVRAIGPGSWGQRVFVKIEDSTTQKPGPDNTMVPVGFKVRVAYYGAQPTGDPLDWFNDATKPPFPSCSETLDDLDTDEQSPNYWAKRVQEHSTLIELDGPQNMLPAKEFARLATNGTDGAGTLDVADFQGDAQLPQRPQPQGLAALELDPYREVSLVYAPGASVAVNKAVIEYCEKLRFRFAVVDPEKSVDAAGFEPRVSIADSQYAALYYPWLAVTDPQTGERTEVPPGGHVLGVYARTDEARGVWRAPANEPLRGVIDLLADIDNVTQDAINSRGINAIRKFPGRGIRVWGARTLSADTEWKYVNVRRLFIFLERSIYEGTQWVVFEPNDERLWARVRNVIGVFLRSQWQAGALPGQKEEDAFFVKCDRTTMTEDDIINGRLICEIGVAVVRPAEFVVFRIRQHTVEAQT